MRIVETAEPPDRWDENLVRTGKEGSFLQTAFWGGLIALLDRAKPIYLQAWEGTECLASLLVLHKIPFDRARGQRIRGLRHVLAGKSNGWLDFSGGPVFHVPESAENILPLFLSWLDDYMKKKGVGFAETGGFATTSRFVHDPRMAEIFGSFGYRKDSWGTYLVDLTGDEEEVWRRLEPASRKAVKKAQRENMTIERIISFDEFLSRFYEPYMSTLDQKIKKLARDVLEKSWNYPHSSSYYRYYAAMGPDRRVLGVLGMYVFAGVATEVMSGLMTEAFQKKLPAQDLLHWEMFLDAKRLGCDTFDLAGVNPNPATTKEQGIRRFKEKWGGQYLEYDRYRKGGQGRVFTVLAPLVSLKRKLKRRN
jgi:hypothetical protein